MSAANRSTATKLPQPISQAEAEFELHLKAVKAPAWEREYRFIDGRKFRFDFAWPSVLLAVEVEGITYDHGRHQRKDGFEKDLEKYELAMLEGWTVYRCSPAMIKRGRAIDTTMKLMQALCQR